MAGWINASLDVPTVLGAITEAARALTDAEIAMVAIADGDAPGSDETPTRMVFRHTAGLRREPATNPFVDRGRGAGGIVLATGLPFRTGDYLGDPRITYRYTEFIRSEDIRAVLVVPVLRGARIDGLIAVYRRAPRPFTDVDENALARLAPYAGVAIRNAELFEDAKRARLRAERLSRGLLELQETERSELARELHDHMGQMLTALAFNLEALRRPGPRTAEETIAESLTMVQRLIHTVRDLSFRLRPAMLDDMGLLEALRWFVDREATRAGLRAIVSVAPLSVRLPATIETGVFRIMQEAMTNVARHAKAKSVTVEVREADGVLTLIVADDGVGFDIETTRRHVSLGLLGMEERATRLGGVLEIESVPGHGTEVRARIPIDRGARP